MCHFKSCSSIFSILFFIIFFGADTAFSQSQLTNGIQLQFSDGRPDVKGFESVNSILRLIGVRASLMDSPSGAKEIIEAYHTRTLDQKEKDQIKILFMPSKKVLLDEIRLAERTPTLEMGGNFSISEYGGAPYPKFSDMKTVDQKVRNEVVKKFSKLHFNTSNEGIGIDELMTVITGGPFTLFFVLPDQVVSKLTIMEIGVEDKAVRLSYPGIRIHGGFMTAKTGLTIGYAHGPKNFAVRFEDSKINGSHLLGTNPWVDFSGETPKLKESIE